VASLTIAAFACGGERVAAPGTEPTPSVPAPPPVAASLGAESRPLKLATWNVYWLTTRDPRGHRVEADYAALRRHVEVLDADLVALQEVDGAQAASLVFDPRVYRFHFTDDRHSRQRAGFAWRKELDVRPNPDLTSLAAAGKRPGADVTLRWSGRELRLLSVHLKSGCTEKPLFADDENCRILREQLPALEAWVDARAREGGAFVVLGDFNRAFAARDAFWTDLDDGDPPGAELTDAGADAKPACFGGRYERYIDHIVLSSIAASWLVPASFHELVFAPGANPRGGLSDHCPLSVVLSAGKVGVAAAPPRVSASDASAHVGRLVTVCGLVASARHLADGNRMTFLNLDAPYPRQPFTIVIRAADRAAFGAPEEELLDKRVCVTGTVETYRGKPQIVARTRDQIRVEAAR